MNTILIQKNRVKMMLLSQLLFLATGFLVTYATASPLIAIRHIVLIGTAVSAVVGLVVAIKAENSALRVILMITSILGVAFLALIILGTGLLGFVHWACRSGGGC